jgi:hypothetical protein
VVRHREGRRDLGNQAVRQSQERLETLHQKQGQDLLHQVQDLSAQLATRVLRVAQHLDQLLMLPQL